MWNASGALLGWQAASLLERMLPPAPRDGSSVTREPGFLHRCVAFALDMLLVWTASLTAWSLAIAILPAAASQRFAEGSDAGWIVAAAFVAEEFVAPLLRAGQTPGGAFVRMTCETRERGPVHRACFLAIRAATIYAALTGLPLAVPALLPVLPLLAEDALRLRLGPPPTLVRGARSSPLPAYGPRPVLLCPGGVITLRI